MQIYIHHNNQQIGPFTEDEVKAQLAAGAISLQDHVWWQGQANWMPLGQSPLAATLAPGSTPAVPSIPPTGQETSKLAIWALVCGCVSVVCWGFASIPAIILGHMGRSEIKKNPALQGGGMALAGMILGYVFTALFIVYFGIVGLSVMIALGNQPKSVFTTITSQLVTEQATNSADQTTNAPDQSTPAPATTTSPDQSTNSAPASTNSPSTNAPDSSTNATPVNK